MREVFIVSAVRTPVGKRKGYLREWKAPELLGRVLDEVVRRIDLDPASIDDVINGTVYQVGEQGFTLARMAVLASSFPDEIPGMSVNRQCGSSLSALQIGTAMIASGMMDTVIASGCEIMTKYPIQSDMDGTLSNGSPMGNPWGPFYLRRVKNKPMSQMQVAQAIAEKWGVTREECEAFAAASHAKAHSATEKGYFKNEIMPFDGLDADGKTVKQTIDETIRLDTTAEKLAALKPVAGTQWITAGISSPVTDGASAVVLMSGERVKELNLSPMARVAACAVVGSDPMLMLTGPIPATRKVLKRAGLSMQDMDLFEVNEAFAPIPLAWAKELDADMDRLNVNGGAMALGHPVGNSGTRLTITAINELRRRKGRYALVTLCTGGAMAPAVIFERV